MLPLEFERHCQEVLEAKTRQQCRLAIEGLNNSVPGPSLPQITQLCSKITGSFGKEARCYLATLCGIRQATQAMGAIQPEPTRPTLTEEEAKARPEEVYTLIDSLPSMEERKLVESALCGTPEEAMAAIAKALDALVLGKTSNMGQQQAGEMELESPDVVVVDSTAANGPVAAQAAPVAQAVPGANPYGESAYGFAPSGMGGNEVNVAAYEKGNGNAMAHVVTAISGAINTGSAAAAAANTNSIQNNGQAQDDYDDGYEIDVQDYGDDIN